MPKPTFANLPAAKRAALIEVALDEFAEHPFAVASVSRIAERAGIAKGSIYQYFENKQELFLYLLDYAAQAQLALLRELAPPAPAPGFFGLLRWQMSASAQVGAASPRLVRLIARAASEDLPFHDEALARLQQAGEAHLTELVRQGMAEGAIDPALDPELAAFMIKSLTSELGKLIVRRLGLSMRQAADDPARLAGPEAERIYDQVLRMLQHGLAPRGE